MGIDSYWFIDEVESSQIGLNFKRTTKIKPICKRLYSAGKLTLFSKEKQKRYIGIRYEAEE
jgi:hypothetical protein